MRWRGGATRARVVGSGRPRAHATTRWSSTTGRAVRGEEKTTACIIEVDGRPIGFVQFYRWLPFEEADPASTSRADADTFGLDIHIGEPDLIDRVSARAAVDLVCRHLEKTSGRLVDRAHDRGDEPRAPSAPTRRRGS